MKNVCKNFREIEYQPPKYIGAYFGYTWERNIIAIKKVAIQRLHISSLRKDFFFTLSSRYYRTFLLANAAVVVAQYAKNGKNSTIKKSWNHTKWKKKIPAITQNRKVQ